jgi:branched-chain amino acid aminotransferase
MFNDKLIVFTDGKYKRLRDVAISPLTHSLHYGSGVFDGIRAHKTIDGKTAVFRLYDYVDRFMKSTKKIGLDIEMSRDEVAEAIKKVIRKNNFSSAYIRLMAFFDHSSLGISTENNKTRFFVAAWQWDKYLPDGLNVGISDFRRISEKSTFVESKFSGH